MGTDVSDFSAKYSQKAGPGSVASTIILPPLIKVTLYSLKLSEERFAQNVTMEFERVPFETRYGTNPHQPFGFYKPRDRSTHVGDMKIHKLGKGGFSLTNLQDLSQAVNVLKYFGNDEAGVILKHIVPCGLFVYAGAYADVPRFDAAHSCDPRSAFGGTVAFNRVVDAQTAEKIMQVFIENVVAIGYTADALTVLRRNEGTRKLNNAIRVVEIPNMTNLPKFWGDDVLNYLTLKSLPTGELSVEVPYLTGVRSIADLITDPEVDGVCAAARPTEQQLNDALTAWYVVMNVRSNAVVVVKNGKAIGVGTGQLDRVGAVELAIEKAKRYGHNLDGAVLASEAFFPKRDSIDYAAKAGIGAILWPAGSKGDKEIIAAANEHGLALMVPKTGERCFLHT